MDGVKSVARNELLTAWARISMAVMVPLLSFLGYQLWQGQANTQELLNKSLMTQALHEYRLSRIEEALRNRTYN